MDMWSVGCILAELLNLAMHNEKIANCTYDIKVKYQSKPLFPGNTCYPLSPIKEVDLGHIDYNDQLRHILAFIRKPELVDLAFISEPSAV